MMPASGKTVALIDPLWIGHHPMYFSQFTASFLRTGAKVIGLCPEPEAAMRDLLEAVDPDMAATLEQRVHLQKLPSGGRSFFNGRFEGDPARTFSRWKRAADVLAEAEANSGMKSDLVYFPYLDSYLRFLPFPAIPKFLLNRPWSGLYLRNHHHGESKSPAKALRLLAKGDAILRSDLCRGIGVLDERFIPAMERYTGRIIIPYPDVTQGGLPAKPFPLALEIQRKARGRKIVGMIGLERRKGFLTLLRTAELARKQNLPYYFVCAGTISLAQFTESEQEMLGALSRGIASGEIDNLHFDPSAGRIPGEADYNSLFLTFDIAWAAYEGFQGSSGTLSKAALFEIPCIASTGECIGQRVEKYGMGLTIHEGDAEQALTAVQLLTAGKGPNEQPPSPHFEDYREDHSLARLDRILTELLAAV
ncbi:MAG: hypothetical protein ABIS50_08400 [Luteolibacter sp.]|uniref:hypothetical protein n=1 Tax=Luteolibacter sp. TaxID=1962973 RepID=UPI003262DE1D